MKNIWIREIDESDSSGWRKRKKFEVAVEVVVRGQVSTRCLIPRPL